MEYIKEMVSIIIPVYQAEKYLTNCVESILNQTYKNFEIILVDDGSDDGSETICDNYSRKYNHIFSIHQRNKGVSSARNLGLDHARGEYILFVDSDDYIEDNYLENAFTAFRMNNIDMYLCGYQDVRKDGRIKEKKYYPLVNDSIWKCNRMGNIMMKLFRSCILHAIGTKIYRRAIIEKYRVRFKEKWQYYEDIYFCLSYLAHCDRIYIEKKIMYYYRRDVENSLLHQKRCIKYESIYRTYRLLYKLMDFENNDYENKKTFCDLYRGQIGSCINSVILVEKRYTIKVREFYQKLSNDILYKKTLAYAGKQEKMEYFCIKNRCYFGAYLFRNYLLCV